MRDHAVLVLQLLLENREIPISRIAEQLGACERTARRWVDSFSLILPIRIEKGVVIMEAAISPNPKGNMDGICSK